MPSATVSTGKAVSAMVLVASAVQVNTGMRPQFMPGARILMMVAIRFTAPRVVPTLPICIAQIQ